MTAAIQARELTKHFGTLVAVDRVTLDVPRGSVFGFLGPNGAGKTTTIRMLSALVQPTSGTAKVAGYDILEQPMEVKRRVGYMSENPYLYPKLTGREFLRFVGDLYSVPRREASERAAHLLPVFELQDKADNLTESYSRGMKQKLALSAAIIHEPDVLFLDEPTSGMDPRSARVTKDLLRGLAQRGTTVLMSTHLLEIAERMCDHVGIINSGRLVASGTLAELREARGSDASLEDIFLEVTGGAASEELAALFEDE